MTPRQPVDPAAEAIAPPRPTQEAILEPIDEAAAVARMLHDLATDKLTVSEPLTRADLETMLGGLGAVVRLTRQARDAGLACEWR